ncbi:MAG: hypothetical protein JXK05_02095 [Campylobacterales bacterium]|nr:hypothetical protein [Campylobacterales bacterium]
MTKIVLSSLCVAAMANDVYEVTVRPIGGTLQNRIDFLSPAQLQSSVMNLQQSSPYLYSPVKEGMQGDALLLSTEGIRLTNALFRSGSNQYFSFIPRAFVQGIEEDAALRSLQNNGIGGEINQRLGIVHSGVGGSYTHYNQGIDATAAYKEEHAALGINAITTQNHHDTFGEVPHSSYNQKSLYGETTALDAHRLIALYSQSDDLPRTDNYTRGVPYDYELQRYLHVSDHFHYGDTAGTLSYQRFEERIDADGVPTKSLDDMYGISISQPVGDALLLSFSDYFERIEYNDARFSHNTLTAQLAYLGYLGDVELLAAYSFANASIGGDLSRSFNAHGGSVRLGYRGVFGLVSQSYRFPSITNLATAILSEKGIDLPNDHLLPERALTYALGFEDERILFKVYYRVLDDLILRMPLEQQIGGQQAFETVNADSGFATGALLHVNQSFGALHTYGTLEYTYGETDRDYLSKITPFRATLLTQYRDLFAQYAYAYKGVHLSQSDQKDVRIVGHNEGYSLLDLGYRFKAAAHEVKVIAHNLFNTEGRVMASSTDLPGRSFSLSYMYTF